MLLSPPTMVCSLLKLTELDSAATRKFSDICHMIRRADELSLPNNEPSKSLIPPRRNPTPLIASSNTVTTTERSSSLPTTSLPTKPHMSLSFPVSPTGQPPANEPRSLNGSRLANIRCWRPHRFSMRQPEQRITAERLRWITLTASLHTIRHRVTLTAISNELWPAGGSERMLNGTSYVRMMCSISAQR